MAFCTHCGRPVNAGASFCPACGTAMAPGPAPSTAPPPAPVTMTTPAATAIASAPRVRPVGVTIIGVVMLIGAAFMALAIGGIIVAALAFGMMGSAFDMAFPWMEGIPAAAAGAMAAFFLLIALVVAAFAALAVATAIGVLKGKSWAWVLSFVVFGLIALNGLGALGQQDWGGILGLAVAGVCIWYFLQPEVKRWFGKD